jgi:hypothetical protein
MLKLIHPIFWWLIGGDWRNVQLRHSSKMDAMPAILDLVSTDFLTNALVALVFEKMSADDVVCSSLGLNELTNH